MNGPQHGQYKQLVGGYIDDRRDGEQRDEVSRDP